MRTHLARGSRILAVTAAIALAVGLAPAGVAQAKDKDCGWNGNVIPLMERADSKVRSKKVTARIHEKFGADATVTAYTRMEVDLQAAPGETPVATIAATLTRNYVTYNLQVVDGTSEYTASAQVRFDGLCYRTTVVVDSPWVGSTGTDKPLKVNANKALRLAQQYRIKHIDEYPVTEPLVSMNLMQATTAPPDFGKLRWYVNYDNGMGGLSILAVYMNGQVSPV
ncbi:MAG: hypothetical protein FJW85_02710 [Actinobacteria bacterium]|nr:hypothetical protein [Actinomycetota bacterium]